MPKNSRAESDAIKNLAHSLATVSVEKAKADQTGGNPDIDAQYEAIAAAAVLLTQQLAR